MTWIDLNADLGEGYEFDVELMRIVSSCNIACGGHAGDAASMSATVKLAIANDVAIGAHPSYPDRDGFGRTAQFCAGSDLHNSIIKQIDNLISIAQEMGREMRHVKPHGALYNDAAADRALADLVVSAVAEASPGASIVGPPDSALQDAAAQLGLVYFAEAFVDRAYAADGSLLPRSEPNAVHTDMNTVTTQALRLATDAEVTAENGDVISIAAQTLCLHGDTANAAELGKAVRDVLTKGGVNVRAFA
ncbi:MAG: 5-oxoprolinase subunit PxpA [Woeseiaceae bacterium]